MTDGRAVAVGTEEPGVRPDEAEPVEEGPVVAVPIQEKPLCEPVEERPLSEAELPQVRADRKARRTLVLSLVLLVALCLIGMSAGRYTIPVEECLKIIASRFADVEQTWTQQMETVLIDIRLPRLIVAVLVGAALATSGASYQGLFRNPLVSPDILGVSSGACVGAAIAILLHANGAIELSAFVFATVTVLLTTLIPRLLKNRSTLMLVLSGVLIGGLMTSLMSFLKYVADADSELAEIVYWTMGSIAGTRWKDLPVVAAIIVASMAVLQMLRWRIDVLSLGDAEAQSLGVNVRRTRAADILCSTLLTSSAVCVSGTVGWIGLVMPHIARRLVGIDNVGALPVAALSSATFLLVIDTIARTVTGAELPLGILTGFIGAPFFAMVLVRERMDV